MRWNLKLLILMTAISLIGAACGSGTQTASSAGGEGDLTVSITEPEDGADITLPFTVKLNSNVPLDDPETGEHHVHIFFDGDDSEYILVYADSIEITEFPVDLPPGEHVMNASLRNADHSAAGAETEITVNVAGGGGGAGSGGNSGGNGGGTDPYNYDY